MGKTHEALERAEKQYMKQLRAASREPIQKPMTSTLEKTSIKKNKNRYDDIKSSLLTRESAGSIKSVLFIDTSNGGKSSDHAIRFAASLTEDSRLKVGIVNLNLWTSSLQEVFKVDYDLVLSDLFSQNREKLSPLKKVGPGNLYRVSLEGNHSGLLDIIESGEFDQFLKNMYEKFNYLVLNATGINSYHQYRILCSKVDSVVLVLKSGKIARKIALNAKKYIENPEDKLLGVLISKTSSYHHQLVKVASVAVTICLIFILGIFLGNSQLNLRDAGSHHYYSVGIPNIKSETTKFERSANFPQMKDQAKSKTISDDTFTDTPKKKIDTQTKLASEQIGELPKTVQGPMGTKQRGPIITQETAPSQRVALKTEKAKLPESQIKSKSDIIDAGEQIGESSKTVQGPMETKQREPIITQETAPSQRVALKTEKAKVPESQIKSKSDINEADEHIHDVQKAKVLPVVQEIEKPMLSIGHSSDVKEPSKASRSKTVVVKEGDNLFRIILRAYGTYNDNLVHLVLNANPEISSPQQIVVGRAINLPEVK
jgi:Mrp family chromosome partitioning ATPase